jgi:hypothetical protein
MTMTLMKIKTESFGAAASGALLTFMLLAPVTTTAAPGTLAESPLFLSNSVEPNILFMLDDSGSMDWGMMTTENNGIMYVGCDYRYTQPAPDHDGNSVPPTEKAPWRIREFRHPTVVCGVRGTRTITACTMTRA